jgi:sulfofructose kinase
MLDGDVAPVEVLERLVPLADYAVFSDAGLLVYTGLGDVPSALRAVAAKHSGHVGASCGPEGYFWVEGDAIRHVAAPAIAAIDTLASRRRSNAAVSAAGWAARAGPKSTRPSALRVVRKLSTVYHKGRW